jgi:hypothetical protein
MEVGYSEVARAMAFVAKIVLLAAAIRLLLSLRARGGPGPLRRAWGAHLFESGVIVLLSFYLEGLQAAMLLRPAASASIQAFRDLLYLPMYLFSSTVGAAVGGVTLAVLARTDRVRRAGVVLVLAILVVAVMLAVGGAATDWQALFTGTRVLTVLRVVAYLGVWVALFTGRLHPVDPYVVAYLAVATGFSLLLPLQETIFGLFAMREGRAFWAVNQLLQTILCLGGALAMGTLAGRLRRGDPPDLLVPGEQRRHPWTLATLARG